MSGTAAAIAAGAVFGAAFTVKITSLTAAPTLIWLRRRRSIPATGSYAVVVVAVLLAHVDALGSLWQSRCPLPPTGTTTPAVMPHPYRRIIEKIPNATPLFWLAIAAGAIALAFMVVLRPLRTAPLWLWVGCPSSSYWSSPGFVDTAQYPGFGGVAIYVRRARS